MEKHFCDYNQSLALKELGYDEPCMGKYDTKQGDEWLLNIYSGHLNIQFSDKSKACIAPLKSQVFEWGRNNHQLFYTIETNCSQLSFEWGFDYTIFDKENDKWLSTEPQNGPPGETTYKTYEEAESACIDKLIEIVKTNLDK